MSKPGFILIQRARAAIFLIATGALLLTGCGTTRLVDSDVSSFSKWTAAVPVPGTPYRFERLPSQQGGEVQQTGLEEMARSALAKVGMELRPEAARYSVQVSATTLVGQRGGYDGYGGYGGGFGSGIFLGGGSRGASLGFGLGFPLHLPQPYYRRDVSIVMRDLGTQQVTFESRALHEGVWSDTNAVVPAMLDSALRGFPEPPQGTRRIDVEIPR
jgi:predicted small secreted protein